MRRVAWSVCVCVALFAAACDPLDRQYFREGIGNQLYTPDIAEITRLQDLYISELCRQSMPVASSGDIPPCGSATLGPTEWTLIVQSGMNDIDRRCDAYLAWLDDRRRTNPAVIKQLGDMSSAAQGIMRLTGVGADPITIVGIAFGLATNTFTNVQSRLLLEVDKTTVQSLVLNRRNDYRLGIQNVRFENRPSAVHALRSYLNICTPFTIETTINQVVTIYEQGGNRKQEIPLIDAATVVRAATIRSASDPLPKRWAPTEQDIGAVFRTQIDVSLCVPLMGTPQQIEQARNIAFHELLLGLGNAEPTDPVIAVDVVRTDPKFKSQFNDLKRALSAVRNCEKAGFRHAFEVGRYGLADSTAHRTKAITLMQEALVEKNKLAKCTGTTVPPACFKVDGSLGPDTRAEIKKFREKRPLKPDLNDAIDNELLFELRKQ